MEPDNKNSKGMYSSPAYGSSLELQPVIQSDHPTVSAPAPSYNGPTLRLLKFNRSALYITGAVVLVILILGLLGTLLASFAGNNKNGSSGSSSTNYAVGAIPLNDVKTNKELESGEMNRLAINGQLTVNNAFILTPTSVPQSPSTGQIYYDSTTNQPYYYNGKQFVSLLPTAASQSVSSIGGRSGALTLGNGLAITGNQLSVSADILQAAASGGTSGPRVTSFQGLTGDVTLAAGAGINISGTTVTNSGVLGLFGTANQVNVSSSTGNITLTLPQDIAAASTPTFGGATLNGSLTITAGGATIQGASGLTLGTPSSAAGSLSLANTGNTNMTILRGLAPAGQNQVITIPDSGAATDTVCLLNLGNCTGGGSGVTSSGGTQNYLPKFTNAGGTQVGNSLLYDNGVSIGVGTNLPSASYILDVNGSVRTNGDLTQSGSGTFSSGTGAVSLNGATSITGTNTLSVGTGATTLGGTLGVTGLTTLSGGTTITGATNINTSGTASTSIGNATGTFSLVSSALNISTAGALSGVTGYTQTSGNFSQSGAGTFGTGSGAVSLNGNTTITGTNTLSVGSGATTLGGTLGVTGLSTLSGGLTVSGTTTLSSLNSAGVVHTDGSGVLSTSLIVNADLQAGTFSNITGTGALTAGSIGVGFGSINIGTNTFTGNGSGLTNVDAATLNGQAGSYYTNASNISSGTLNDARLSSNVTLLGNTFNGINQLVQLDGSGFLPALNGSALTSLNGSAISSGTVANTYLTNGGALTVTAGAGLSGGGSVALGGSTSLSVTYGSGANTAVQGNTSLTCASGTGNLSGGGNSITLGSGGSCNNLTITNSPTFSGDLVVQGSGGVTIGIPGSVTGNLNLANSSSSRQVILQGLNPTGSGNATIQFPSVAGGTTDTVCLYTLANCTGVGGGITGGGTAGNIAKFSGAGTIADSTLSESGSTVTASGNVAIQGTNSLSLGTASTNTGSIAFYNSTNGNTVTLQAGASGSNFTLTLPTGTGSNGDCIQTDGSGGLSFQACTGGAGGGVTSLDGQTGVLSLSNATGSAGTITIDDASTSQKGIAQFNATNFTASSGTINTIQNIDTSATPTFGGLTISGTTTLSALNSVGVVHTNGSGVLSTSPIVDADLQSGTFTNITGVGALTAGSIGGSFGNINIGSNTFTGNGSGLTSLNGSNISSGTVADARLSTNVTLQGNTFNGINQLVQLDGSGFLPALNGSALTSLNGSNISSGTVANARLVGSGALTVTAGGGLINGGSVSLGGSTTLDIGAGDGITVNANDVAVDSTVCRTSNNCSATGTAGGDLTGTYPNPTIASLQGETLTISGTPTTGSVLQYNGSAFVDGLITNTNLQAGTFSSITGTGALTAGSIGGSFGNINIGSNTFTGNGSGLTSLNGSNISSGTVADARLSTNVTLQGNTFNGINQLVQLDGSGFLPALNGSALTSLNGSNISSGTVANARLVNSGALTVTAGTGLSGGGSVALGSSTTLNLANTAVTLGSYGSASSVATFTVDAQGRLTAAASTPIAINGNQITSGVVGSTYGGTGLNTSASTGVPSISAGTWSVNALLPASLGGTGSAYTAFTGATAARTYTLPDTSTTICTTSSVCAGYAAAAVSGNYIQQIPTNSAANTITPATSGVVGLTVNGTNTGTAATAFDVIQGFAANGQNINLTNTSGTQAAGLAINRNGGGGTTTDLLNLTNTAGTVTNAITIAGTFTNLINSTNFGVTNAGAVTAVGVNAGTGLLQGALGLTVTGATANINASSNFDTNINTGTSTGAISIGNSAAGAISLQGGSSINLSAGTASTISTAAGNLTLQGGSGTVSLGTSTTLTNTTGGLSVVAGGVGQNLNLDAATTGVINIGNTSTGNILLGGGSASTGCTVTNSTGDFACAGNINSVGGVLQINGNDINAGGVLSNVAYLDTQQTFTADNLFQSTADSPTAFQVQNSLGSNILSVDASTMSVRIGSVGTPTGQLYVSGSTPVTQSGSALTGSSPYAMAIQGRYAYVTYTSGTDSLQIFDISDPTNPVVTGSIATGDGPRSVAVQGRYAYVANNNANTVQIFDISNPTTPVLAGSIGAGNSPDTIAVQGRYAYVGSYSGGTVNVYDISNPASPVLAGSVAVSSVYHIVAQGRYAYVATWSSNNLVILNILNPASPTVVSTTPIGANTYPTSVYVQDKYAYITKWLTDEIEIYDISDPANPLIVGAQTTVDEPHSIYVQGRTAYVSGDGFIETFDVSDPTLPVSNGTFAGGGYPSTVIAQGRNLYVLSPTTTTIEVFDIGGAYIQQLEVGGIEAGTLTTRNNASIGGTLSIQGGLTVFDSSQFSGSMGLSGSFKSSVNSSTAFQVQNANNVNLLSADTSVSPNLITNPSFETGTTGWAARSTATLTQTTAQKYVNAASLSVATGAAANNGAKYNYALASSTQYSLSFYAKLSSGTFTTMQAGRTDNGTTGGETNCLTGQTVSTTQWTRFTCTFTTGTTSGTPYIYIKQSDATARTFFIDGVQLELAAAATNFNPGTLAIDGVVNSHMTFQNGTDATNAFQIQNSAGTSNLLVADTINNRLAVGQATANYTLDVNGAINITTGNAYKINGVDICTSSGCTVLASSGIKNQTTSQTSANFNIQSTADASITGVLMSRASQTADLLQSQNSSGTKLSGISADGSLTANAQVTGTTATTSGTGTNTTTVTLTGSAFANGDVILIDNAGQDYYTRITAGGGTASLTVSPAVTFETGRTVTKYTIQNIGATTADYTTQSNRFFQGYFLGGVVAGAGTTTLSDSRLSSTTAMNFNSPSYIFQPTGDSATAFQVLNNAGMQLFNVDSLANAISIGNVQTGGSISLGASMTTGTINIGGTGAQTGNIDIGTGTGVQALNFGTGGTGAKTVTIGSTAGSGQTMLQSGTSGTLVKGATSTTAFQVQNANSDQLFNVDTTATQNLLTNSNFETNITGWSAKGSAATPAFDITQRYIGIGSLKEVTTAAANDGTKYDYALASNTTYGFSFYAKLDSASAAFATMKVGYSNDGSTDTDCLSAQTVSSGGWTRFSCLFTTGTTSGTPYVYIKQSDATIHTYYIDGAQLQTSSVTSYKLGQTQINGIITSPVNIQNQSNSTTALTIQNASGEQLFGIDTSTTANLLSNSSMESDLTGWAPKNLVTTNSDFETNTTGWAKMGTNDAISRTTGEFYYGAASLQVVTSATDAAGADGAKYTYSLLANTTYTFSVYAKASGSSFSTFELGRSENGSTNTSCLTAQTVSSTGWANYTCTFTTGGSVSGTRYIYVRQTDQATRTFYIDSVSLTDSVLSRSTAQHYSGDASMRIVTTATLNDGAKYNHALASNTTYTYSFYANLASGSFRSLQFGRSDDGTPESEKMCTGSQTVVVGVWTRYSCTFTTGTTSGSPYLFIKQSTLTSAVDFYVDAVQLEAASSNNLIGNGDLEVNADGWVPANYIANGEFESDIIDTVPAGWAGLGAAITKVVTEHNLGLGSTKVVTTAAADDGARTTTLATGLTASKTYTFTIYAKADSGSFSTLELGRSEDAGSTDTSCLTGQTVTTAWAMYTCTFTTGGSVTGGSYVYVKQTDATARTFYIDSASLTTATVARTTGEFNTGAASLQVDTVALAQDGVRYKYGLQANTNYTVVAYAKLSSGTFTALQIGRSDTGLTDTSCLTSQTVTTSGWTRYECNFTAGSTVNTDTSYIYFKQTSATGAPRTFYIDSVSVISSSPPLPYQQGRISIAGVVSSPVSFQASTNSSTAFQVLNASGGSLLTIDSTTANTVINGSNVAETQAWPSTTANASNGGTFADGGMVAANGYMYVVGGFDNNTAGAGTSTVSYAKIKTNGALGNWTVTSPMPATLAQHTTVVSNGYIYAIGGFDSNFGYTDAVYYAKLNSDGTVGTWRSTTPINNSSTTRYEHASIIANGYLYVIGGVDNLSAASNDIYYTKLNADGSVGTWSTARDLPLALSSMAASVANGYVYITGGNNSGFAPVNTTYFAKLSSDGTIGTWNTANSLPTVVADHQTVVLNGYIYSIGGYGTSNIDTSSVYYAKLNPNGSIGSWVTNANSLTTANSSFGATTANGYIYVGGGWNNTGYYVGVGTAAIVYTSTARTQIAGSLDLVGTSGQTLSDSGTGGSLTAGNTTIVGTLDVIDQAHFMQGVSINGTLTAQGDTAIRSATNSATAFQVQNANSDSLISVDTAATPNLMPNPSIELGLHDWTSAYLGPISRSTSQHYVGRASLRVDMTTNGEGVNGWVDLASSTQYTLSFYAKASSSFSTMYAGYSDDLGATNCLTGQTVSSTSWTRFTCTFTTSTTTPTATYIYILQNDVATRTMYIDGVQLEQAAAATNFKLGTVAIDGIIDSHAIFQNSVDSTTAFQIQNAAGNNTLFNVDTQGASVGIANSAVASSVNIGNTTGASALTLRVGTGNFSLDGVGASTYSLGASTTSGTITIGGTAGTGTLTVGQSTATNTINIGSSAGASNTQTINIGKSTTASSNTNVTVGSLEGASTTTMQGGSGGVVVKTPDTAAFSLQNTNGETLFEAGGTGGGHLTLTHAALYLDGVPLPGSPTLSSSGSGGSLPAGNYAYRVSAHDSTGLESTAIDTTPGDVTTTGATSRNTISWTQVSGATGYYIYRSTDSGASWAREYVGNVASAIDNGVTYAWSGPDVTAYGRTNYSASITLQSGGALFLDNTGNVYLNKNNSTGDTELLNLSGGSTIVSSDSFQFVNTTSYATNLSISNTGQTLLQNSVDSDTAFQVQNANGDNLLQVDTLSNTITIGGNNSPALTQLANNTDLPVAIGYQSSVTANGYVYVIGGIDGASAVTSVRYAKLNSDGTNGTWNSATSLPGGTYPAGVSEHVSVVANGYVYVIGGYNGSSALNIVSYAKLNADGTVGSWNTTTNLPNGLDSHSGFTANGYVYVVGGYDGTSNHGETYYAKLNADGTIGSWTATSSLPSGERRTWSSSVVANGYAYVIGGKNNAGTYMDTVYYAQLNSNGTVSAWNTTNTLPQARAIGSAVVANGYIYYIGGEITSTNNVQDDIYYARLNANGTTGAWQSTINMSLARDAHTSVVLNGYVYVIGGYSTTWEDSVYKFSTQRIQVGGALDLVGLGGANLADGQVGSGGELTAGNTNIVGLLQVQGQANFAQGVNVTGNLSVGGTVTFNNTTNSTTAFQIQNSSSTPLFVADTTNSRLYVGNPTADSTGAVLVLDTKNTSGDPTGVDGAMYYNSSSKSFRCYSNGAWRSCVGGVVFANTSLPGGNTISNTAAETNFASNYTIPANDCQPGRVYKITANGVWGQNADATAQMKIKMGSTVIGQTNNNNTNASGTETNRQWKVEYEIICQTSGGSGTVEGQGVFMAFYNDDITTSFWEMKNTAAVTVDTTTSQTLQMSFDWGTAHANNTFTLRQFIVESSGP